MMLGGNLGMAAAMMDPAEFDDFVAGEPPLRRLHLRAMFRARLLVSSQSFSYLMLAVIVANTVVLAMEYDGMTASYEQGLVRRCWTGAGWVGWRVGGWGLGVSSCR